jgi:hypothetical protein
MKKLLLFAHLALAIFVNTNTLASEFVCPESLEVTESATTPDNRWIIVKDAGRRGHFIDSVSIYAGHPRDLANLAPDRTKNIPGQRKTQWNLPEANATEYWLACAYTNSLLMLARPLPREIRSCILTESRLPSGVRIGIVSFVCQ